MSDKTVNIRIANLKLSINVFFRWAFSSFMGILMYMSLMMIVTGFASHTIGERIVEFDLNDTSRTTIVWEQLYSETTTAPSTTAVSTAQTTAADNAETSSAQSTASTAVETLPTNQVRQQIRSEVPKTTLLIVDIIGQALMLMLLFALPYSKLWNQGDKDSNSVQFGRMKEDRFRGLKVGLIASIPMFAAYLVLLISKFGLFPKYLYIYRWISVAFLPILNRATSAATVTAEIPWLWMFFLFLTTLFIPFVCHLAYRLGFKHIAVSERIIYVDPSKKKNRRG